MSTKKATYSAPTLKEAQKAFGKENIGKPVKVKPRACKDIQGFIAKIDQIYKKTKESCIQFD